MKHLAYAGLALASVAMVSTPTFAADLPQEQPVYDAPINDVPATRFDWSGAYAGGNLGWVWGGFDTVTPTDKFGSATNGVSGGVHGGYNFAITPNVITGVELDFQMTDLYAKKTRSGATLKSSSAWNSSARARLGYAMDRFLVYGTGGLAIADVHLSANGTSKSKTAVGWTAGAGVESAVTNNVTARIEYLYQDYGTQKFTLGGSQYRADLDDSTVRFGLSYKF